MTKTITTTDAPAAIGTYSQAAVHQQTLYVSGQIPLDPSTMETVEGDIADQVAQVFDNLSAICRAAGTDLQHALKFTVYVTDLTHFPVVNKVMQARLQPPYPARAVVEVSRLPKDVAVEIDAIVGLES